MFGGNVGRTLDEPLIEEGRPQASVTTGCPAAGLRSLSALLEQRAGSGSVPPGPWAAGLPLACPPARPPSSCIKQSPYRKCLAFLPGNYSSHSPMRIRACLRSREDSGGWREIPAHSLGSPVASCKLQGPVRSWWPVRIVRRASGSEGHQRLSPPSPPRLSLVCLPWSTA